VTNIVNHLNGGVTDDVQVRAVEYWRNVDPDLGARVAKGLGVG
jgi:catalase